MSVCAAEIARDDILFDIVRAVRSAARAAIATPGWATFLRLPPGLLDGKAHEKIMIGACPYRATALNELVILDLNLPNDAPAATDMFDLLSRDLEPFIAGVGEVRSEIVSEGRIILRRDDRKRDHKSHERTPIEITPEMIDAGVSAISQWVDDYAEIVEIAYVAMERERRRQKRED